LEYKNVNDYELVYQIRENDEYAYQTLLDKYSFIIHKYAYAYYQKNKNLGIEYDDFVQEGFFALVMSLKDYNPDTTLFYTYASLCIRREMERLIKQQRRNKHMVLNTAVSFSTSLSDQDDLFLEDVLPSSFLVENDVIDDDLYQKLFLYKHHFSFEESSIYELKIHHFNNKEIATLLDIPYKKVDNSLKKIRKLLFQYQFTL